MRIRNIFAHLWNKIDVIRYDFQFLKRTNLFLSLRFHDISSFVYTKFCKSLY